MIADNLTYYAGRMVERGRFADAVQAIIDAYQAYVDEGIPVEERHGRRSALTMVCLRVSLVPDLPVETYALARSGVELALAEDPGNPAMTTALGAALYREGDFARAAQTLALVTEPLKSSGDRLASKVGPADHLFRAMAQARLGAEREARAELEAFRAALGDEELDAVQRAALAEAQALIEHDPSRGVDD